MTAKDRAFREQRRIDRRFAQDVDNGLRQALATPEGRALLSWLRFEAGLGALPYVLHQPEHTSFRCGQLSIGLALDDRMQKVDIDGWETVLREERRRRLERGPPDDDEDEQSQGDDE